MREAPSENCEGIECHSPAGGGLTLTFPKRQMPAVLRNVGQAALILGAAQIALVAVNAWASDFASISWVNAFELLTAGLAFMLGAFLLFSKTTIDLAGDRIVVREAVGRLAWRRSYPRLHVTALRVEILHLRPGARPERGLLPEVSSARESSGAEVPPGIPIIALCGQDKAWRVLAFGYSPRVLHAALKALVRAGMPAAVSS